MGVRCIHLQKCQRKSKLAEAKVSYWEIPWNEYRQIFNEVDSDLLGCRSGFPLKSSSE